ncbi:uncharacterized protein LOC6651722 [Drosophila willistoni]|uniref:uncharacterized protein LOC6651722 n=1 Tax=Drosophila willistoni TaxID=7260 RepID=UPI000C26C56D|nr:uncharacterized protein LOC6651722 [Drosophila willistoni]
MEYNKDELEAPKWLDKQFFTKVLQRNGEEKDFSVLKIKLSPASVQGDHYASVMFRALIEYQVGQKKQSIALIIKTMPEEEGVKKEFLGEESKIFQTEIAMYTKVLPKFEKILQESGEDTILSAKCLYHSLTPRKVIVLEDLLPLGFEVVRYRDFSQDELQAALSKLAKWHAVSYKILQEEPETLDELRYDITNTIPNFLEQDFVTDGLTNFINMLDSIDSLKKYKKYFEKMQGNLVQHWVNIIQEYRANFQSANYYVLCHGDFHRKNMMFKNNKATGEIEACMLIDFQLSYLGPMTNDIIYAIYMLFEAEHRKDKQDELIYFYFKVLEETLNKIEFQGKMPNLLEYRRQLFQNKYNDFFLMTTFMPAIIAMHKEYVDFGDLSVNPKKRTELYYKKDYQEEIKILLPRMLHLGYFEELEN